jgi:anti-sigma-K factor RskA
VTGPQDLGEHDLVASYALDALDELEARRFERHLDGCEQCQRELGELLEATTFIAEGMATGPPPELKRRVMARIDGTTSATRGPAWFVAAAAAVLALVFGGLWATSSARLSHAEQITSIYQAADAASHQLTGTAGDGVLTYAPSLGQAVFLSHDLEPAAADSIYELWLIDDNGPHPAGLFHAGEAVIVEGIVSGQVIAVTMEPKAGSDLPTGPVLLSAQL